MGKQKTTASEVFFFQNNLQLVSPQSIGLVPASALQCDTWWLVLHLFFLQLQSTSPHATRVEPLFASTIGYPRDLWPRLFRQSASLHPDCALLAAPSADITRSRRRSTARSLAFTGYHAERSLLVLLPARPPRWKATFYTDSLNVQRYWKKGQEHSIRGQFIYTSTWRQIWDRIDEIKPHPIQVKRMTDDATMEHVREGAVTPCKGDLPGLVREVSGTPSRDREIQVMERRDAQGAEAPPRAAWGSCWCSNKPRRKRATHTRAGEEWHRLVLLEGPTRPKECKGLFCKAAAECSKKIKALAAGADLAGSACRIVASLDVVQAATKVGWDWCDVVYELAPSGSRVCNPAGLKTAECGKHLDQKSQQRIEKKRKKPAYCHERMLFQKCTPYNAVIDRRGHQAVTHGYNEHASSCDSAVRHMVHCDDVP